MSLFAPTLLSSGATVRMGEEHIPQLVSLCALLAGGVSQFLLISFPRVPVSQIKALSLPSFVLHLSNLILIFIVSYLPADLRILRVLKTALTRGNEGEICLSVPCHFLCLLPPGNLLH